MKYVTDHFTIDMIKEQSFTITTKTMNRNTFMKGIEKAKSCIKSKKIRDMLHKHRQEKIIKAKKGDEFYIITCEFGRKHSCDTNKFNQFRYELFTIT